jgi:hypothetical protein
VPRREMVDAPFATLEADYCAALDRRQSARVPSRRPRPRRDRVDTASRL